MLPSCIDLVPWFRKISSQFLTEEEQDRQCKGFPVLLRIGRGHSSLIFPIGQHQGHFRDRWSTSQNIHRLRHPQWYHRHHRQRMRQSEPGNWQGPAAGPPSQARLLQSRAQQCIDWSSLTARLANNSMFSLVFTSIFCVPVKSRV
jgi:hypothetical protein